MTVILKANGPADLLAMAPPMVGFLPRNSVVLVAFRGKRTGGAMRFDLPPSDDPVVHKRVVTTVVGMFCKLSEVDAAVVIVYTDHEFGSSDAIPMANFAELIGRRLTLSGFDLRESICQATDGWASYFDTDVPVGGHPLARIAESTVARAIDGQGGVIPPLATMIDRVPRAAKSQRSRLAKRLEAYEKVGASIRRNDGQFMPSVLDVLEDLPLFAERALDWDAAELDAYGALLVFALQGPPIRDLVMLQWSFGIEVGDRLWDHDRQDGALDRPADADREDLEDLADADLADAEDPADADLADADLADADLADADLADAGLEDLADIGDLMMGIGRRPDPRRIEGGIALLLELTSRAEDARRPPLLCMLAWLNWALGHGSQAGLHLDEALAIEPTYSMAQLLEAMTRTGILPEWAFEIPPPPVE